MEAYQILKKKKSCTLRKFGKRINVNTIYRVIIVITYREWLTLTRTLAYFLLLSI